MSENLIFDKNIHIFRQFHPQIAEQIISIEQNTSPLIFEQGKKGMLTLKAQDVQGEFYLHSIYDPLREAEQYLSNELDDISKYNDFIQLGFGLGYLTEVMLQHVKSDQKLIIIEPDIFSIQIALSNRNMSSILSSDNIHWIIGDPAINAVVNTVNLLTNKTMDGWRILITPAMARHYLEYTKLYTRELASLVNTMQVQLKTELQASEIFIDNGFKNLRYSHRSPGVSAYQGKWEGKPVVMVAAGPSLDKQLPVLREYQDRVLIIAVGQAWRSLREAGIVPHFLVTVDPFDTNLINFYDIDPEDETLLVDIYSNPHICELFKGDLVFSASSTEANALFAPYHGDKGVLETGGSVSNNAFSFAQILKASPVIMIGLDLSYPGGISHATGNAHRRKINLSDEKKKHSYYQVEGYFNEPVYTNRQMDSYRHWFENHIPIHSDISVINSTEGGALIRNAQNCSFKDAITAYASKYSLHQELIALKRQSKDSEKIHTKVALNQLQSALNACHYTSSDAVKLIRRMLQNNNTMSMGKFASKLAKVQEEYGRLPVHVRELIDKYTTKQRFLVDHADKSGGLSTQLEIALEMYTQINNVVGKVKTNLNEVLKSWLTDPDASVEKYLKPNNIINIAVHKAKNGDEDRAIDMIKRTYKYHSDSKNGYAQLGWLKVPAKDWKGAFDLLAKDEREGRLTPHWMVNTAQLYGRLGDFEHAVDLIKVAYNENNNIKDGYSRLSWIKAEDRQWKAALDIAYRDEHEGRITPPWMLNLAQLYGRQGDFDKAESLVELAYVSNPNLKDGYSRLGWIKAEAKDWSGALEIVQKDEAANRQSPARQVNLAQLYGRAGDFTKAESLIEVAYAANSQLKDGYSRLGWIKAEAKDWSGALEIVQKDEAPNRQSPARQVNLALLYGRMGSFTKAESLIDAAYAANGQLKDGYGRLGWIKTEEKDWSGAFYIVKKDEALNRQSPGWQINLAQLYGRQGDYEQAQLLIAQAYAANEGLKDGYGRLGWIKTEEHDWEGAIEVMRKDISLDHQSPAWMVNLAEIYFRLGHENEAEASIQHAYEVEPKIMDGYTRLANICIELGNSEKAISLYSKDKDLDRVSDKMKDKFQRKLGDHSITRGDMG